MITSIKDFINESRGISLDELSFNNMIKDVKWYDGTPHFFRAYSTWDGKKENCFMIDPKNNIRPYKGGGHISFLIDNLESWKDYPRRNESVIFTNIITLDITDAHGDNIYEIIPIVKKIAVAPSKDINLAYGILNINKYFFAINGHSILNFYHNFISENDFLLKILNKQYPSKSNGFDVYVEDFDVYINFYKENKYKTFIDENKENIFRKTEKIDAYLKICKDNNITSFRQYLNIFLSPEAAGFKLVDIEDMLNVEDARECWTDGICIAKKN